MASMSASEATRVKCMWGSDSLPACPPSPQSFSTPVLSFAENWPTDQIPIISLTWQGPVTFHWHWNLPCP